MRHHRETRVRIRTADRAASLESIAKGGYQPVLEPPDGVLLTDPRGTIVYVNNALEALSGYDRAELVGRPASMLAGTGSAALPRERSGGVVAGLGRTAVLRARTGDRRASVAEWSFTPMLDAAGSLVGYVGIARDRVAQRALESRLSQASKMEAVGRLAGGITHDFNNLLAAIRGYTELVAAGLPNADPRRADLDQVMRAADRAAELTHKLLAFSRRQVLQPRVIDPARIVGEIEPMLTRLLGDGILLSVSAPSDLWHVDADPGQLEQVIVNLAVNARDAMPAGGTLTIALANVEFDEVGAATHREVTPGPYVELVVADTGEGMDAETLAHAFEPFFTTKALGAGTGLGLASVYGFVKQSGGFVYVVSKPVGGTKFTIYLPRVAGPADPVLLTDALPPMPDVSRTVMLVESDTAVRDFMRRVLEPLGYSVLVAGSAGEAIGLAAETATSIDVLITDVFDADVHDLVLAARLRTGRDDPRVLLVSGYTEDAHIARGELEPGVTFLAKPFTAIELAQRVHQICGRDAVAPTAPASR